MIDLYLDVDMLAKLIVEQVQVRFFHQPSLRRKEYDLRHGHRIMRQEIIPEQKPCYFPTFFKDSVDES